MYIDPIAGYPATLVRVWRGDILVMEEMLSQYGGSCWLLIEEDCTIEKTPYDWRGEGSLRLLQPVEEPDEI